MINPPRIVRVHRERPVPPVTYLEIKLSVGELYDITDALHACGKRTAGTEKLYKDLMDALEYAKYWRGP